MEHKVLIVTDDRALFYALGRVTRAEQKSYQMMESPRAVICWIPKKLIELAGADVYDPGFLKRSLEELPLDPGTRFKRILVPDNMQAYTDLLNLFLDKKFTGIVNACRETREAERIFRELYDFTGSTLPVKRMPVFGRDDESVWEGLCHLKDPKDYDGLYLAGKCRNEADWLIGLNLSRGFTLKFGEPIGIGRNQTPMLSEIVRQARRAAPHSPADKAARSREIRFANIEPHTRQSLRDILRDRKKEILGELFRFCSESEEERVDFYLGMLLNKELIRIDGKYLVPTEKGEHLVDLLPVELGSFDRMILWEKQLLEVEHHLRTPEEFMGEIRRFMNDTLDFLRAVEYEPEAELRKRGAVGKCPLCGKDVKEGKRTFYCEDPDCRFEIRKHERVLHPYKKKIDRKMAEELLYEQLTIVPGRFSRDLKSEGLAELRMEIRGREPWFALYWYDGETDTDEAKMRQETEREDRR